MVSTRSCSDWIDFIPFEYVADTIGDKIGSIWAWMGEDSELPAMYPARKANVKYCRFSPNLRYQKMFCGHKFKIGGHKE